MTVGGSWCGRIRGRTGDIALLAARVRTVRNRSDPFVVDGIDDVGQ
jgi:hypothetical protein